MDTYNFTVHLIKAAGRLLEEKKKETFAVSFKGGNPKDIVTSLDLEINDFITSHINEAYPEHSIYSEEAAVVAGNGYQWAIDPIDGSASFARSIPQYSISIGLLKDGIPVLGAVLDPVAGELFSFKKGEGAWLNGEPISPSKHTELRSCFILLAAGRRPEQVDWAGESLKRLLRNANKTKNFGSSAMWLCYLAAGRVDGVIAGTFSAKDIAAAVGILTEVGGVLTGADGRSIAMSSAVQRVYAANNESIGTQLRELLESA